MRVLDTGDDNEEVDIGSFQCIADGCGGQQAVSLKWLSLKATLLQNV